MERQNHMNTRLSYHYRDQLNCRQYTSIVLAGTVTWTQIEPYLARQHSFIPGQLGLEDLQLRFALPGRDQPWHQIGANDVKATDAVPTVLLTADELAERFAQTPWDNDWIALSTKPDVDLTRPDGPVTSNVHMHAEYQSWLLTRAANPIARSRSKRATRPAPRSADDPILG
jgi:hypothetical protein